MRWVSAHLSSISDSRSTPLLSLTPSPQFLYPSSPPLPYVSPSLQHLTDPILPCASPHCIVFILFYFSMSIALLTASSFHKRSRPQQLALCRSLHAEALQATASEGLAQGPYVAAREGFKPRTLRSKGVDSTNAPPRPNAHISLTFYQAPPTVLGGHCLLFLRSHYRIVIVNSRFLQRPQKRIAGTRLFTGACLKQNREAAGQIQRVRQADSQTAIWWMVFGVETGKELRATEKSSELLKPSF